MKTKFFFLFLCTVFVVSNIWSQDIPDWVWNSPRTMVYPTGEYINLPVNQDQINYKNPNTTTRVVNQNGQYLVLPPNIRPFPSPATQSEIDADNMAGNTQVMYISWNSWQSPTFFGCGFAYTNNGGTTWNGSTSTYSPNSGDPGPYIYPAGSTWAGRLGLSSIAGNGHSDNGGVSWTFDQTFPGGSSFDKNLSDVDDIAGSPFFGRAYTVWTNFGGAFVNRIVISYSINGGATWTTAAPVSPVPSGGHHHQGCDVEVGPGGVVYVVWGNCTTSGQNSTEDFLGFAKSLDGGVTWTGVNDFAVDVNGIRAAALFNGIRANGFPRIAVDHLGGSRNGWIYVALGEKTIAPATDVADMCLCLSINGGTTWTHTRINQDTPGNGKYQYMGDIDVAPDGSVCCSYYDQRNTTSPVTQYWMSRSLNGGTTWLDVAVSDHSFTPSPIPGLAGGYQGDYTGITTAAGKVWPFWADNSSGVYQAWTDGILVGPPPANDVIVGPFLSLPATFTAGNNHTIRARVANGGTLGQTNLPIRFSVNGTLQTTNTIPSLPPGAVDSSQFTWNPATVGTYTLRIFSGAAVDENRLNDTVTTTVTVLPSGTTNSCMTTFQCRNNINRVLCDVCTTYDTIIYTNVNAVSVTRVTCKIDTATHTYDADVTWSLSHGGQTSTLCQNRGGSGDNFIGTTFADSAAIPIGSGTPPFTGLFRPETPLSVINGTNPNGMWILIYNDNAAADTGLLKAWCISLCFLTTVGGIQTVEIPNYYSLSQNYPNPFNPATQIKYTIPKAGNVVLKIYDVLGKEVKTLVNEKKEVGVYNIDFDASNLSSGIYFYRIESGDFTAVKKMMLIK